MSRTGEECDWAEHAKPTSSQPAIQIGSRLLHTKSLYFLKKRCRARGTSPGTAGSARSRLCPNSAATPCSRMRALMSGLRSSMMLACFLCCRREGLFLPCGQAGGRTRGRGGRGAAKGGSGTKGEARGRADILAGPAATALWPCGLLAPINQAVSPLQHPPSHPNPPSSASCRRWPAAAPPPRRGWPPPPPPASPSGSPWAPAPLW